MSGVQTQGARLRGEVNQWGLTRKDCENIKNILSQNVRVERAVLFGSRAMKTFRNASDIDLALEGENLTMNDVLLLRGEFDESSIPFDVDLVIRANIENPELEKQIKKYGEVVYCQIPR